MRGNNNTFSIIVLAFVFAALMISLPALGASILSGALSLNDPVDDAFMSGTYTLEAEAFSTTLTNVSFYYHGGTSGSACDNLTTGTFWTCDWDNNKIYKHDSYFETLEEYAGYADCIYDMTFDGVCFWTCDFESGKIYKQYKNEELSVVYEFDYGEKPSGLMWDGEFLWCCGEDKKIKKYCFIFEKNEKN